MLSDEERTKILSVHSSGSLYDLSIAIERAVLAKASQQVAGFDECCATGQSCEYEICTLNGEQQCKYCGKEHPDMAPIQAMPAPKQEPIYQYSNMHNVSLWTDCNKETYEIMRPEFRRTVYSHPAPAQAAAIPEAIKLLGDIFDLYEDGVDCYSDYPECEDYIGKAIQLGDDLFDSCVNLLNSAAPKPEGE